MQVFNSINELPSELSFGLTIGNFDGVHLGHQKLIKEVIDQCHSEKLDFVVMTFVPHPLTILKNKKSFLLNSYKERQELLANLGVKWLIEVPFTRDFSTQAPSEFLDKHVLTHDGLEVLMLGYDFAFGANKKGDHDFVKSYCADRDIKTLIQSEFTKSEVTYSSSLIRSHLEKGEVDEASKILGRKFFVRGRVIKGAGRGKQIGFPTANIALDFSRMMPDDGVYSTSCIVRGCRYKSITNIGTNPTFNDAQEINIETNIFDFNNDIYGEEIQVEFHQRIREEEKFKSVNDLIAQIKRDIGKRGLLDD